MFKGLTCDEISAVFSQLGKPVLLNKGDQLYKNGMLGIITSGKATIKRHNDIGDAITIRTISDGELFGAASVFGNWKDGMSSIIADTACEVLYITEEKFCEILKEYPQMSLNYIIYLSDRIRFLNRKLDAFTAKSTEERLYEYLLSQADSDGNINLSFGMAELARRLQVGRTSIYRDIESLQSKKLISRNGHNFKILK
ncbi:MAG: Crp/Fnr family transcriptional regulator [Clostridia bacterium]|nr:Crp/Fnr family transcriptional regulator [Clostridia bacterium]